MPASGLHWMSDLSSTPNWMPRPNSTVAETPKSQIETVTAIATPSWMPMQNWTIAEAPRWKPAIVIAIATPMPMPIATR